MDWPSSWTLSPTYKRYIGGGKNTTVIILIFVSWLIIATDVLLLLLYFMFPISWDYCIPGSLHCFIFFLIIFCFTTPFLPFFFLCFCQFLFFVYLLFQIGTKEMDWCTLSLVLCPSNHLRFGEKEIHVHNQLLCMMVSTRPGLGLNNTQNIKHVA